MLASTAAVAADSDSPFDLINGIPLHPLVVHAAVVLVPLSALGVLLMAAVPRFSRKLGWLVVLGALAATGACFVAKLAGQQLAARIGEPGFDHQSLGDLMPWFATGLAVVAAGLWLVDRRHTGELPTPRGGLGIVVAVLAGAVALGNLVWVYRVGDSGARSVWSGVVETTELPPPTPSPTLTPSPTPSESLSPSPVESPFGSPSAP